MSAPQPPADHSDAVQDSIDVQINYLKDYHKKQWATDEPAARDDILKIEEYMRLIAERKRHFEDIFAPPCEP